ncbi:MAG TPA: DUF5606 domain-containing protein [Bacteroidia bacterium]|nr:DUF5606 domain-containing protein [Bacteroidia bacterium]
MDISKVISISGMPGLYKVIAQSKNGVIVESLTDQKRFPAFGSNRISTLEDISIYTTAEELPLKEVLRKIFDKEKGGNCIDPRSADEAAMREYMLSVVPEYDAERVHVSDLKKLFTWYNLLNASGLLTAKEEEKEGEEGEKKNLVPGTNKNIPSAKKEVGQKKNLKSNAPKVKAQGVRKTGTA